MITDSLDNIVSYVTWAIFLLAQAHGLINDLFYLDQKMPIFLNMTLVMGQAFVFFLQTNCERILY